MSTKSTKTEKAPVVPQKMLIDLNEPAEKMFKDYLKDYLKKNGSIIIRATKIAEMPSKGGFVVIEADEDTIVEKLETSFETAVGNGVKFSDVFHQVQLVPNKNDGDKFDALFAFKTRGGPKEARKEIADWRKALTEEFEKGQLKTVSQYKTKRLPNKKRKHSDSDDDEGEQDENTEGESSVVEKKKEKEAKRAKKESKAKKEPKEDKKKDSQKSSSKASNGKDSEKATESSQQEKSTKSSDDEEGDNVDEDAETE